MPLGDQTEGELRVWLKSTCLGWIAVPVRWHAECLGFIPGPEAGTKSWDRALDKAVKTVLLWSLLGLASTMR